MSWKIVERKIGKAGNLKQRQKRQQEWNKKYGDNWMIGYIIDGEFVSQEDALENVYYESYKQHFENNLEDLEELINTAKTLSNPHSKATGGVDLQVPAIMSYLNRNNLELKGNEVVDIGTYGEVSHKISVRLSPLTIKCSENPRMTLEKFWQDKKCLAIWDTSL
ncbi:hypothetical protein [Bernardetia sp.]|uniref:hypothetical protein n=1 Tax=Bernardetia sp. TaxID=1937974 RepID=UPI0025BECEC9|nr:hypothetical protein [Bernardetia sp.]